MLYSESNVLSYKYLHTFTLGFWIQSSIPIKSYSTHFTSFQRPIPGIVDTFDAVPSEGVTVTNPIFMNISTTVALLTSCSFFTRQVTKVTITTVFTQIAHMTLRAVCANNILPYLNTAGSKFTRTWLAVIFFSFSWISIESILALVAVVTSCVVLADAFACHRVTCIRMTITLAGDTP